MHQKFFFLIAFVLISSVPGVGVAEENQCECKWSVISISKGTDCRWSALGGGGYCGGDAPYIVYYWDEAIVINSCTAETKKINVGNSGATGCQATCKL